MVKWQGRLQSSNVEDRRGAAAAGGAGIILMLLRFIIGRFGVRGLLILAVFGVGLYMVGVNPVALLQGGPATTQSAEKRRNMSASSSPKPKMCGRVFLLKRAPIIPNRRW